MVQLSKTILISISSIDVIKSYFTALGRKKHICQWQWVDMKDAKTYNYGIAEACNDVKAVISEYISLLFSKNEAYY